MAAPVRCSGEHGCPPSGLRADVRARERRMCERGRKPGGGITGRRMRKRITLTGANQGARRGLLRNTAARTVCLGDKRRLLRGADVGRSGGNFVRRSTTAGVQGGGPKSEDAGFYGPPETEVNPSKPDPRKIFPAPGALKDSHQDWQGETFQRAGSHEAAMRANNSRRSAAPGIAQRRYARRAPPRCTQHRRFFYLHRSKSRDYNPPQFIKGVPPWTHALVAVRCRFKPAKPSRDSSQTHVFRR